MGKTEEISPKKSKAQSHLDQFFKKSKTEENKKEEEDVLLNEEEKVVSNEQDKTENEPTKKRKGPLGAFTTKSKPITKKKQKLEKLDPQEEF